MITIAIDILNSKSCTIIYWIGLRNNFVKKSGERIILKPERPLHLEFAPPRLISQHPINFNELKRIQQIGWESSGEN